jgi:hypothetical protein
MKAALLLAALVALTVPALANAKGFTRVALVGSDGRWVDVRASEYVVDGLLSRRGATEPVAASYVRLFFVGADGFPAAPARYYPERECVALDWPRYETSCRRIGSGLVRRLRSARALMRFRMPPTVLASIKYHGVLRGPITSAAALEPEVELALDRASRATPPPRSCYAFSGRWRGPAAGARPQHFQLCPTGIYANRRLYPLDRGVWAWFRLNVD